MREYRLVKKTNLAEMLLDICLSETTFQKLHGPSDGFISEQVLQQYFSKASMRKAYPVDEVRTVLGALVAAGFLEMREKETGGATARVRRERR